MFEWAHSEVRHSAVTVAPTFGFFALALELYAFAAARVALSGGPFLAPLSTIFFALDHTEFMVFVVAALCGVDYFVKPTPWRAIVWGTSLVPLVLLVILVIYLLLH